MASIIVETTMKVADQLLAIAHFFVHTCGHSAHPGSAHDVLEGLQQVADSED